MNFQKNMKISKKTFFVVEIFIFFEISYFLKISSFFWKFSIFWKYLLFFENFQFLKCGFFFSNSYKSIPHLEPDSRFCTVLEVTKVLCHKTTPMWVKSICIGNLDTELRLCCPKRRSDFFFSNWVFWYRTAVVD